jgi:hypothetical protein
VATTPPFFCPELAWNNLRLERTALIDHGIAPSDPGRIRDLQPLEAFE